MFYESGDYHNICMGGLSPENHWRLYSTVSGPRLALDLEAFGIDCRDVAILDIGCGPGAVLAHLKSKGATVRGFDVDPEVISFGRRYIADIFVADANDAVSTKDFDVVHLGCVLPHLNDPVSFLDKLHSEMENENQHLVLSAPNLDGNYFYSSGPFAKFLHIGHLWYFNPTTMTELLKRTGFRVDGILSSGQAMVILAHKAKAPLPVTSNAFWESVTSINLTNARHNEYGKEIDDLLVDFYTQSFWSRVKNKALGVFKRYIAGR